MNAPITPRVVGLFFLLPVAASAVEIDLGFESGAFQGWHTIGNVSIVGSEFGVTPFSGNSMALLSTGPGAVPASGLLSFLGIDERFTETFFQMSGITPTSVVSALKSDVITGHTAGTQLMLSNGGAPIGTNMGWELVIEGPNNWSGRPFGFDTSSIWSVPSATPFEFQYSQGWFNQQYGTGGMALTYTVAYVVVQNAGNFADSGFGLLVDQGTLKPIPPPSVPESGHAALILTFALAGILIIRRGVAAS